MGNKSAIVILLVIASAVVYLAVNEENTVGVNLHGVNHTAETFSFYLKDPDNPELISGGSGLIDPFGAGGIGCCAVLPRQWQPGLKLQIHTKHWLKKLPDGTLPEIKEVVEAVVPEYADGKPGEIWVLRNADGKIEVVSSDYQPDHPDWPGKTKGWPIPTIEYRRERWELYRKLEEGNVKLFTRLLEQLRTDPDFRAKEAWDFSLKDNDISLKRFSGPDDPRYRDALKARYTKGLEMSQHDLKAIIEAKP